MKLTIDDEFRDICRAIISQVDCEGDASLVESDDEYQCSNFCGGWQSSDSKFWFSFYAPDGGDYIFSLTIDDVRRVAGGGAIDPPLEFWKKALDW